ncbi:MAG: hypothetical protein SFV54_11540 [Bryobacteraceae bacterium]|nr:hypothetical protein [Bryobacteraceae bacterium]
MLITQVDALSPTSDHARRFAESQQGLREWRQILSALSQDGSAFTMTHSAGCWSLYGDKKETKLELVMKDRLADASAAPEKRDLGTVSCSPLLSVSAGYGWSNAGEVEYAIVDSRREQGSNLSTVKEVGRTGFGNWRGVPAALIHVRLADIGDRVGLHVSTGTVVDPGTGKQTTGGLDLLAGASLSLWRTFFVTVAAHHAKINYLGGAYTVGSTVPSGVTQLPTEANRAWKFAVILSYGR